MCSTKNLIIKVAYESENVIKTLTSGNSKAKDDTTIATVSNKYTSKYNFASGTAFSEIEIFIILTTKNLIILQKKFVKLQNVGKLKKLNYTIKI